MAPVEEQEVMAAQATGEPTTGVEELAQAPAEPATGARESQIEAAADASPPEAAAEDQEAFTEAVHCASTLAQDGDPDEAVAVLRNECAKAPSGMLGDVFHKVIEAYLKQDRADAACEAVSRQLQACPGSVLPATQEIALRALVQAQQHVRAVELLRLACASGSPPPGDAAFNGVVDAAVRARAYGEAWDVLELLLQHRRRADKYFVSILTKSLETSSDRRCVRRGIALVDRFIEQQQEDVDEIVFNSLLNVLGHISDMQKLQQTLNKMTEYGVMPSAVTYGTVVKAYGRARDIEMVLKVWNDMRARCLGVNPVTCGCVLDACVKCGCLDKAMGIFQEMRIQGLHKNTVLYATLIKGLAKVRDLASAVSLYQEMRHERVPCNLVTFNSLMDVCVRCSDLQTAALFLQDMMQMGIEPDLITFSTLIKGYSHTGEVHKALALSKELKSRGLKCDEIMYNSLIDGCAKAGKVEEGMAVFHEMLQSRVAPSNITFSILVKLHFEAGQIDVAFRTVEEMAGRYRCAPSRIVYTVLLRCCAQFGGAALARGAALLAELSSKRNSKLPDQGMVGAVITGCAQHRDFETAARLVRDFTAGGARRGNSLVPLDCLKSLFEAYGQADEAHGQELLEYLKRKSLPVAHINQLQTALADGRRRPAPVATSSTAPSGLVCAQTAPGSLFGAFGGDTAPAMGFPGFPGAPPAALSPAGFPGAFSPTGAGHPMQTTAFTPPPLPTGAPQTMPSALDQYYYPPQQPAAFHYALPHSPFPPAQPADFYQAYQSPYQSPYQHLGYPYGMVHPGLAPPLLPQQPLAPPAPAAQEAPRPEVDLSAQPQMPLAVPPPPRTWGVGDKVSDENAAPAPPKAHRAKENQDVNRGAHRNIPQKQGMKQQRPTNTRDQINGLSGVAALNPHAQLGA